ncbi:CHAD domain-containing protein [Geomonas azotofigens]|uniref:CHAD domain-containing protein n=1 Tax=Geomonas azotofigens TaxID=2843196 RepID=UPI001C11E3AF|nr:CHAD domain-containing protein [Geomonas azotofigens]MBU5613216.1 CHAD domain-containing protein [Geomonas azotofigens]
MSDPAYPTPVPQLQPTRLWHAASHLLAALGDEFFSHWRGAVRDLDPDEVHDLRVASRRLREGLALFAPVLPGKRVARLSRRVKKLTSLLGELRNLDEALLFFSGLDTEENRDCGATARELVRSLTQEREGTQEGLAAALARFPARKLRRDLVRLERPNPFAQRELDPFGEVGVFAERALDERAGQVEELFPAALHEEDTVAQHRLRIAFKKLRYRLEILAPLLEDEGEEARRLLKRYQDLLGRLHDLDVFAAMVEERVAQGTEREGLLRVLAARRAGLFAQFARTHRDEPLTPLTRRVSAASQPRH